MLGGEVRHNFAVKFNTILLNGCDERAVVLETVLAKRCIQANNPERAVVVLLVTAVRKCILAGVHERLLSTAFLFRTLMAVPLGALEHIATALCRHQTSFDAWHTKLDYEKINRRGTDGGPTS